MAHLNDELIFSLQFPFSLIGVSIYSFIYLFSCFFHIRIRSSRPEVFYKKGVLKNFSKLTRKHLRRSLFLNKIAGLRLLILLKKRLWHKCFPVNFVKYLRIPIFIEHLWWLLLQNNKHYLDRFIPMNSRELLIKQWDVKSSDSSLTLSWRIGWRL